MFFDHKMLKKTTSKVAQKTPNPLFFPYCPDSKMWPKDQLYIELGSYAFVEGENK